MFRRRRVRHSYPQPVIDLVVRLVPVHGALALSRMLDIPKSVIYRWRAAGARADAAASQAPPDAQTLDALFERCEQSGFPLPRYARHPHAPAVTADAAPVAEATADADAGRVAGADAHVEAHASVAATAAPSVPQRQGYVYDAGKERPLRGVRSRMEAVRQTLDTRYFLDVDCRTLAESAGMSHYHFIRVFHAMYGTSPHQYLTRTRVEAAKRLLLGSTEPIEVIAVGVGFRSGPSMSRAFKRIEGASASKYFQMAGRSVAKADAAAPSSASG